jgi:hypothetical protein
MRMNARRSQACSFHIFGFKLVRYEINAKTRRILRIGISKSNIGHSCGLMSTIIV